MRRGINIAVVAGLWALCTPAGALAWSGKVVIHKTVEGTSSALFEFDVTGREVDQSFALADGGTETIKVHKGTYTVTEQETPGYELRDLFCTEDEKDDSSVSIDDRRARLVVQTNETVECTFVNAKKPASRTPVTPPAPKAPPPPPPPGQDEKPLTPAAAPVVRGNAKLRGPTGCASSRRPVRPTVTGTQIASVSFSLDGRRIRQVHSSAVEDRWFVTLRTRHLRHGTHRVRAVVVFFAESQTKTRVLNLAFARCAAAAPKPKFTG